MDKELTLDVFMVKPAKSSTVHALLVTKKATYKRPQLEQPKTVRALGGEDAGFSDGLSAEWVSPTNLPVYLCEL